MTGLAPAGTSIAGTSITERLVAALTVWPSVARG